MLLGQTAGACLRPWQHPDDALPPNDVAALNLPRFEFTVLTPLAAGAMLKVTMSTTDSGKYFAPVGFRRLHEPGAEPEPPFQNEILRRKSTTVMYFPVPADGAVVFVCALSRAGAAQLGVHSLRVAFRTPSGERCHAFATCSVIDTCAEKLNVEAQPFVPLSLKRVRRLRCFLG